MNYYKKIYNLIVKNVENGKEHDDYLLTLFAKKGFEFNNIRLFRASFQRNLSFWNKEYIYIQANNDSKTEVRVYIVSNYDIKKDVFDLADSLFPDIFDGAPIIKKEYQHEIEENEYRKSFSYEFVREYDLSYDRFTHIMSFLYFFKKENKTIPSYEVFDYLYSEFKEMLDLKVLHNKGLGGVIVIENIDNIMDILESISSENITNEELKEIIELNLNY